MEFSKADARQKGIGIKGLIYGQSGIGKTSLLKTLPAKTTLVVDLEAGLLAINGWDGDSFRVRNWQEAKAIASIVGGVDPAAAPGDSYSKEHHDKVLARLKETGVKINPDQYSTIFIDSVSVASNLCWKYVIQLPECFTKTGTLNTLRAYGALKREMIDWLMQLQHAQGKNVWFVGLINNKPDGDEGDTIWKPQMASATIADEIKGIVDIVITLAEIKTKDKDGNQKSRRGFITHTINPWRYPAKDRSSTLSLIEPAHLGALMEKIKKADVSNPEFDMGDFLEDEIIYN